MGKKAGGRVSECGPLPEDLDERVRNRDSGPLPEGAFLRFQSISHSPDPRTNHRWVLYEDGRLFLAFHSRDTAGAVPFDTPLPKKPTARLDSDTVDELRHLLVAEELPELAPYQCRPGEGGMWQVVTARMEGGEFEVVYDRASTPLIDRLQRVASEVGR